jgi:hypothetical protein
MSGVEGIEVTDGGTIVVTGPGIAVYQLLVFRARAHMEIESGMRFSNRTPKMSTILRQRFGWKGKPESLLQQLEDHIEVVTNMPLSSRYTPRRLGRGVAPPEEADG